LHGCGGYEIKAHCRSDGMSPSILGAATTY